AAIAEGDGEAAARRMRAHMLNAASALGRYVAGHRGVRVVSGQVATAKSPS
ncbi:DNA-binding GntR family transcriptional regulator, partial [Methylobacterium sp. BE186]|nr:DNA-binding GntR family transcriptional regulator [Methylobacterium sp. BE186]